MWMGKLKVRGTQCMAQVQRVVERIRDVGGSIIWTRRHRDDTKRGKKTPAPEKDWLEIVAELAWTNQAKRPWPLNRRPVRSHGTRGNVYDAVGLRWIRRRQTAERVEHSVTRRTGWVEQLRATLAIHTLILRLRPHADWCTDLLPMFTSFGCRLTAVKYPAAPPDSLCFWEVGRTMHLRVLPAVVYFYSILSIHLYVCLCHIWQFSIPSLK